MEGEAKPRLPKQEERDPSYPPLATRRRKMSERWHQARKIKVAAISRPVEQTGNEDGEGGDTVSDAVSPHCVGFIAVSLGLRMGTPASSWTGEPHRCVD
jgi:hypothetical protein